MFAEHRFWADLHQSIGGYVCCRKEAADRERLAGFIDRLPETEDHKARIPMGLYGRPEEVLGHLFVGLKK